MWATHLYNDRTFKCWTRPLAQKLQSNIGIQSPDDSSPQDRQQWIGALWKVGAFLCYALLNALARYLSGGAHAHDDVLPVNVILFFQDFFALLFVLPWLVPTLRQTKKPQHIKLHLFRVMVSAGGVIFWYYALYYLPQADAVALSIMGPLMGLVGAHLYLKEKFRWGRVSTILLTLILATWMINPFEALTEHYDNLLGLGCVIVSSLCFAMAKIATRKLASVGESTKTLTVYLLVMIVPVTFVLASFVWVMPNMHQLGWLMLAGLLTAVALYAVSNALAHAEVSFLAPFDFIRFIINASIGYFAFTELPAIWSIWLVFAMVVGSVSFIKLKQS